MISRKTTLAIAEIYAREFHIYKSSKQTIGYNTRTTITYSIDNNRLYDFLYMYDFPAWFCNASKYTYSTTGEYNKTTRDLKEFILRLHTGETQAKNTPNWTWEQRKKLGQEYLYKLSQDILKYYDETDNVKRKEAIFTYINQLKIRLELDGYIYRDSTLLIPEKDVLDIEQERGLLETLYVSISLENKDRAFKYLDLSEEHYVSGRWGDSIHNSRLWLESVLQEVAVKYSQVRGIKLPDNIYKSPKGVREYLKDNGLLEPQEKDALATNYGLLSGVGSHPYMSQKDQARLLRQQALIWTQFIILRLQGILGIS